MEKSYTDQAKVTFGIIVLNGEPFIRANLRALYPFAHQIIIVEGASPHAAEFATPDGHSLDDTVSIVREFKNSEDPDGKVQLVIAEDEGYADGFWPGEKTEQSQVYARRCTGDFLWQIDVDEFYMPEDMGRIIKFLSCNPSVNGVLLGGYHFFCGTQYVVEGGYIRHPYFQGECFGRYRRIFRWRQGWYYAEHRPPTILDEKGRDITASGMIDCKKILGHQKVIFHYFRPSPEVISRKGLYYHRVAPLAYVKQESATEMLLRSPTLGRCLRVFDQFNTFNWLVRFKGQHPPEITRLIRENGLVEGLRPEIIRIVSSTGYYALVALLHVYECYRGFWINGIFALKRGLVRRAPNFPIWSWRFIPLRWHKYRDPYWNLDPSCARYAAQLNRSGE